MNAMNTDFEDKTFDIIIDKGTFDSIICMESSNKQIESLINEVYRLLKTSGYYLLISIGTENRRLSYFVIK